MKTKRNQEKKYTAVKSEYIKTKIIGTNWNNKSRRNYLNILIELEDYVLNGAGGWAHAIYIGSLRDHYREEYDKIFKELKPEAYQQQKEQESQAKLESEQFWEKWAKENRAIEERQRKDWLEAGGASEGIPPKTDRERFE
jgi:hypothetical protein